MFDAHASFDCNLENEIIKELINDLWKAELSSNRIVIAAHTFDLISASSLWPRDKNAINDNVHANL